MCGLLVGLLELRNCFMALIDCLNVNSFTQQHNALAKETTVSSAYSHLTPDCYHRRLQKFFACRLLKRSFLRIKNQ